MKLKGFNDIREDESAALEQQLSPQQKIQKIYEEKRVKKEEERRLRLQKDPVDNSAISVEKSTVTDAPLSVPVVSSVKPTHDTVETHEPISTLMPPPTHDPLLTPDAIVTYVPHVTHVPVVPHEPPVAHGSELAHVDEATHDPLPTHNLPSTHDTQPTLGVSATHDAKPTHDTLTPNHEVNSVQEQIDQPALRVSSTHVPSQSHVPVATHDIPASSGVQSTHVPPIAHVRLPTHNVNKPKNAIPKLLRLSRNKVVYPEASPVHIKYNYAYRDRDLIKHMHEMTGDEWKVYCYLLSLTHEKWEGETHCWTSQYVVAEETGIGTRKTAGLVLESLEAKGFIQRTYVGNRVIKLSQYRVFLPCEMEEYKGTTEISYTPRKPKT